MAVSGQFGAVALLPHDINNRAFSECLHVFVSDTLISFRHRQDNLYRFKMYVIALPYLSHKLITDLDQSSGHYWV